MNKPTYEELERMLVLAHDCLENIDQLICYPEGTPVDRASQLSLEQRHIGLSWQARCIAFKSMQALSTPQHSGWWLDALTRHSDSVRGTAERINRGAAFDAIEFAKNCHVESKGASA